MKISNLKRNSVLVCALLAGLSGEMLGFKSGDEQPKKTENENTTVKACKEGKLEYLKKCQQYIYEHRDKKIADKKTLLHIAAENGRCDVFTYLVANGYSITKKDGTKQTAEILANKNKLISQYVTVLKSLFQELGKEKPSFEIIKKLYEKHTFSFFEKNPIKGGKKGLTALEIASKYGHTDIVAYMLSVINSTNVVSDYYNECIKNAISVAAKNTQSAVINLFFVKHKGLVLQKLNVIIENGMIDIVKKLIEEKIVTVNEKICPLPGEIKQETMVSLATEYKQCEIINYLIEKGAKKPEVELPVPVRIKKEKPSLFWPRLTGWLSDGALALFGALGTKALTMDQKERPAYLKKWVLPSFFAVVCTHMVERFTKKNVQYLGKEKVYSFAGGVGVALLGKMFMNNRVAPKLGE